MATGLIDAVSILALGHVFVANMTGNIVFIGFAAAGAPGFSLPATLSALAGFLLGALPAATSPHDEERTGAGSCATPSASSCCSSSVLWWSRLPDRARCDSGRGVVIAGLRPSRWDCRTPRYADSPSRPDHHGVDDDPDRYRRRHPVR